MSVKQIKTTISQQFITYLLFILPDNKISSHTTSLKGNQSFLLPVFPLASLC